jgi:hypothetical protein
MNSDMFRKKYNKYKTKYLRMKTQYGFGKISQNVLYENVFLVHANELRVGETFFNKFELNVGMHMISRKVNGTNEEDKKIKETYVHCTWGTLVYPHINGIWEHKTIAFVVPLKLQDGRIFKINPNDTMIFNGLAVGENSYAIIDETILKQLDPDSNSTVEEALQRIGFKVIRYNTQFISNDEINDIIRKFESVNNNCQLPISITSTGKQHIFNLNLNYNENVSSYDGSTYVVQRNDKQQLINLFSSMKETPCREDFLGMENTLINLKKMYMEINIDMTDDVVSNVIQFTNKQLNELYIPAFDLCLIGKSLRNIINDIPEVKRSFINTHQKDDSGRILYEHPNPYFTYNGNIVKMPDDNVFDEQLSAENIEKRSLMGRHYGLDKYITPYNCVDWIQYLNVYENVEKNKYETFKSTEIQENCRNVLERMEGQFPFSEEIRRLIYSRIETILHKCK